MKLSRRELAKMMDHTLIRPSATKDEVIQLGWEAGKYGFTSVVVSPFYVSLARHMLEATEAKMCCTVGFPVGAGLLRVKAFEARKVVELGAEEIDMVMNTSALKSKDYAAVEEGIKAVLGVKRANSSTVIKAIVWTGLLSHEEKIVACNFWQEVGADFVKISTGLLGGRALVKDVRLLRDIVGKDVWVKAAGGIRTLKYTIAMIKAGVNRIGTSAAVNMIKEILK